MIINLQSFSREKSKKKKNFKKQEQGKKIPYKENQRECLDERKTTTKEKERKIINL